MLPSGVKKRKKLKNKEDVLTAFFAKTAWTEGGYGLIQRDEHIDDK